MKLKGKPLLSKIIILIFICAIFSTLLSCPLTTPRDTYVGTVIREREPAPWLEDVSGSIKIANIEHNYSELQVRSLSAAVQVDENGNFKSLAAPDQDIGQILVVERSNGDLLGVAYNDNADGGRLTIGSRELALGLLKLKR